MAMDAIKRMAVEDGLPLHTVSAEVIQIAFLDALYAQKESTEIVFHGGTSIRLLHGGYRYSEDLDFAIPKLSYEQLKHVVKKAAHKTELFLTTIIGNLAIELKQRPKKWENVYTWWLRVIPADYRGKIHVKLEFGRYPVYLPYSQPVTLHHPLLNLHPLTISPSIDELMLDKITALAGREYLKNRDLFDIWYLATLLKPTIDYDMLLMKFNDYRVKNPIQTLKKRLADLNASSIAETMERFLPERHRRSFAQNNYHEIINTNRELINKVIKALSKRGTLL